MFPDLRQLRQRIVASLSELADTRQFRIGLAVLLACGHLLAFSKAGHDRLGVGFNSSPGERPYYSDPDAPSVRGFPRQPHHWSRLIVSRWDSEHYIGFAVRGLTACPDKAPPKNPVGDLDYLDCGLGWLPAYGLMGGWVSEVTGIPEDVSLVLISVLCAMLLNLVWTSPGIVKRIGKRETYGALIAFNVFPTAFYLVAPYTESITLLLAIAGFVCLIDERFLLASIFVGASTMFRASAAGYTLGLCLAVTWMAYTRRKGGDKKWWKPLVAIPLAGWGMAFEMLMFRIYVGDFTAYLRARAAFGDYQDFSRLLDPQFYLQGFTAQHMDSVMILLCLVVLLVAGRDVFRRFTRYEVLFLVVAMVFNFAFSVAAVHEYWGLNRYLLQALPVFFGAGVLLRKNWGLYVLFLVLCAMVYWHVELCSYVSHGNAQICPCLGRYEFGMPWQS